MSDGINLVCARFVDFEQERFMKTGSVIDVCHACEQSVWVSPEGIKFIYTDHPDGHILCSECAQGVYEQDAVAEAKAVPGSGISDATARRWVRKVWGKKK